MKTRDGKGTGYVVIGMGVLCAICILYHTIVWEFPV